MEAALSWRPLSFQTTVNVRSWHNAAFAAAHHLGRDWTTTDKRRFWSASEKYQNCTKPRYARGFVFVRRSRLDQEASAVGSRRNISRTFELELRPTILPLTTTV